MKLSPKQIEIAIKNALETGKWMIRRSNDGKSCSSEANGFCWQPIGVWTEAPDWNEKPECGGGLHGNGPNSSGYWIRGKDIDFCIVENAINIDSEKIKCQKAMVLMRNRLPDDLHVGGYLDFSGTQITSLPDDLHVGGEIIR